MIRKANILVFFIGIQLTKYYIISDVQLSDSLFYRLYFVQGYYTLLDLFPSILGCRLFPSSTLEKSSHTVVPNFCRIISQQPVFFLVCDSSFFPCCLQNPLFIFNVCLFNFDVSWSGPLWFYLTWGSLCILHLDSFSLLRVQDILSHNFIKQLFCPFLSLSLSLSLFLLGLLSSGYQYT